MNQSPYHLAELPAGPAATAETIAVMARLAAGVYGAQSPQVRDIAVRIVAGIPSRDYQGEAAAVLSWVRTQCRYRRDPVGLERVAVPLTTIADQAGDCDDLALVTAALLGSLGHQTRFVTGGMQQGAWSHVWLHDLLAGAWVALDPCDPEGRPPGWEAPFPHITPWPVNAADGFNPTTALRDAQRNGLAGVPSMDRLDGFFDFLGSKPAFATWATDPALGPLPDPKAWFDYNDGNPPTTGGSVPHWNDATTAQRGAWLKAMLGVNGKAIVAGEQKLQTIETVARVTTAVATLGTSEVLRAWDGLVADCHAYRDKRTLALAQAQALAQRWRPSDAQALRDAVKRGDDAIAAKLGVLKPWLAAEAGLVPAQPAALGFLPTVIGGMAAPVALALIAAVAAAIAFALAEVAHVFDSLSTATGGFPWLLIVAGGAAFWYWKRKQAGKPFLPQLKANPRRMRRNPAWRAKRLA